MNHEYEQLAEEHSKKKQILGSFLSKCYLVQMENPITKAIMKITFGKNSVGEINPDGEFDCYDGTTHEIRNVTCIIP